MQSLQQHAETVWVGGMPDDPLSAGACAPLSELSAGGRWAPDRVLRADEVAEHMGMTPQWVYEQSRRGLIPHVKLGRYYRCQAVSINAWLAELDGSGIDAYGGSRGSARDRGRRGGGWAGTPGGSRTRPGDSVPSSRVSRSRHR
jgi:predicted DNA-binding transcriptional regulator AlpA